MSLPSTHLQDHSADSQERILSEDYVSLIFHNETYPFSLSQVWPEYLPQPAEWHYAILNAPLSQYPPSISAQGYFTVPKLYTLLDTLALEVSGIPRVQEHPHLNLLGKNICIGFIDTGIDYQHPAFRRADGSSRIAAIWDQTISSGTPPDGFLYGTEYTQEMINAALRSEDPSRLVPTRDEIGHGTALAGIAAGTPDDTSGFSGAAPEAELVVVKLKPAKQYLRRYFLVPEDAVAFQEDDCMLAIRYLEQKARSFHRPMVICFGLGTNQGGHDGRSPLAEVMSYVSYMSGIYVVAAAGNESGKSHHYFGTIDRPQGSLEAEVSVDRQNPGFTMEFWAFAPELYTLGVTSPLGEKISPSDPRSGSNQEVSFLLDNSRIQIEYEVVEYRSGSELIQVRVENPSPGIWRFPVLNQKYLNGNFHLWLPITGLSSPFNRFLTPNPDTTLTAPSNNTDLLTVSTYQASTDTIYLHSSRGYTRSGQLKPDLAAPGVNVTAPSVSSGYTAITGSSAAAALTAGAAALLVQWGIQSDPGKLLTASEMKNLLYRGTGRSRELSYPNRIWGFGTLNLYGVFEALANL